MEMEKEKENQEKQRSREEIQPGREAAYVILSRKRSSAAALVVAPALPAVFYLPPYNTLMFPRNRDWITMLTEKIASSQWTLTI